MCGILGAVPAVDPATFQRALDRLAHRGPDGDGVWRGADDILLGHRRLAIIDTTDGGHQPMHYRDRYHLVFNGEIYNFVEVRRELEALGQQFHSQSDTEVLLAAYVQWGPDCLKRLNGMWALAIWDSAEKTLFLSRDRMGEKPLFYLHDGRRFIFASEQKALLPFLAHVEPSPRFHALVRNPYGYEGTTESLFKGLSRFPAGHHGLLANGKLTMQRYWAPAPTDVPARYEDQVDMLRALLLDSTAKRMRADVAIGTGLSGGIDSSAVAAAIAVSGKRGGTERAAENWQNAFVATFPNTVMDESVYARAVAHHLNIPLTEIPIDAAGHAGMLERLSYLFEEVHEVNPIPHVLLYKAMRDKGIVVSLDGHGGDELFCGYESSVLHALPSALGSDGFRAALGTYRDIHPHNDQFRGKTNFEIVTYLARQKAKRMLGAQPDAGIGQVMDRSDSLNAHLVNLSFMTVLPTLLRNYDHYSMISGVEVRIPLLDHRIVEFAFSIPWSSKVRGGFTKSVLRDAVAPWLPESIVRRKTKIGFAPPIIDWMRGPLRAYLLDEVGSRSFREATLVDPARLGAALHGAIAGDAGATLYSTERIWKDFGIYLWEKNFIQNQAANDTVPQRKLATSA
jgi:asparagine synthase (glutamine-hydrolysing)